MMWKIRMMVAIGFMLTIVPLAVANPTIVTTVTPNPGGAKNTLRGSGTWDLAANEEYVAITFETELNKSNPVQTNYK